MSTKCSGELKIDFQDGHHGSHLGFLIGTILAIFDLQVTLLFLTKFRVNWPFGSGEEAKNRFSRWPPWLPSWISDQNNFSYLCSTSHPDASYQVLRQLALKFRRRSKKIGGHLGFPTGTILAIFDLEYKSPWCFLSSFESSDLSVHEKKRKIDFQNGGHLRFPIGTI